MSQKLQYMKCCAVLSLDCKSCERKGGKAESVHQVTSCLTGYEDRCVLACV